MTLKDFIETNNLPDVKRLGRIKGTTFYIEKNIPDEETGIPLVIQEKSGSYSVCISDNALWAISVFGDNENEN